MGMDVLPEHRQPKPTRVEFRRSAFDVSIVFAWFFTGELMWTGFFCSADGVPMEPRLAEFLRNEPVPSANVRMV